ncbi:MAG: hypothetical protein R2697_07650 [Ilumatobacteraceae bacterium]
MTDIGADVLKLDGSLAPSRTGSPRPHPRRPSARPARSCAQHGGRRRTGDGAEQPADLRRRVRSRAGALVGSPAAADVVVQMEL